MPAAFNSDGKHVTSNVESSFKLTATNAYLIYDNASANLQFGYSSNKAGDINHPPYNLDTS